MLTSFTDPRRRVWNVGDYAVCRVFDPPTRLLSCHVAAIHEPVDPNGRRSFAVDVMLYLPASNRIVPHYVHDPASQLFPSFDTFNAEEADANRDRVTLANCSLTANDPVLRTIAAVRGWLIHENDFTLQNWQEYTRAALDRAVSFVPGERSGPFDFSSADLHNARVVLSALFDDLSAERQRRYDAARGCLPVPPCMVNGGVVLLPNRQGCDTSTTTSTTTTTANPARTTNRRKGRK